MNPQPNRYGLPAFLLLLLMLTIGPLLAFQAQSNYAPASSVTAPVFSTAYTNATTSFTNVPGLVFSVAANTNYVIQCNLTFSVDTQTATPNWQFTGPAAATSVLLNQIQVGTSALGVTMNTVSGLGNPTTSAGNTTITTMWPAHLTLSVQNGANAGTVQLQAAAHGAGILTITAGSGCTRTP